MGGSGGLMEVGLEGSDVVVKKGNSLWGSVSRGMVCSVLSDAGVD